MGKKKSIFLKGVRGSAIIMALVTMLVLVTLGLAVITLSMGNLKVNQVDAVNNDAYYAALAGVNSAIEQLKFETSKYYKSMLDADSGVYPGLYNNFFLSIKNYAQSDFAEPRISGITTSTTFSNGTFDSSQNTGVFLISCTATAADGSKYKVNGSVQVKRIDISASPGVWFTNDSAVKAGGELRLSGSNYLTVWQEDIIVAELQYVNSWQIGFKNGGQLIIDPSIGSTIHDTLKYKSFATPVMTDIDRYVTVNNTTLTSTMIPAAPVGITTDPGINITFSSCNVPNGIIYGKGDVTVTNGKYDANIYCDGNFVANSCTINGNVYCRGNVTINGASMVGEIKCDGFFTLTSGSLKGTVYSGNGMSVIGASSTGSLFSPKTITISNAGVTNGVVYSSTKIKFGNCSISSIMFSGGDVEITGGATVNGAIIAKNDIYYDASSLTVKYSSAYINSIMANPTNTFFFSPSTGEPAIKQPVILDQNVSAVGRLN